MHACSCNDVLLQTIHLSHAMWNAKASERDLDLDGGSWPLPARKFLAFSYSLYYDSYRVGLVDFY